MNRFISKCKIMLLKLSSTVGTFLFNRHAFLVAFLSLTVSIVMTMIFCNLLIFQIYSIDTLLNYMHQFEYTLKSSVNLMMILSSIYLINFEIKKGFYWLFNKSINTLAAPPEKQALINELIVHHTAKAQKTSLESRILVSPKAPLHSPHKKSVNKI